MGENFKTVKHQVCEMVITDYSYECLQLIRQTSELERNEHCAVWKIIFKKPL